MKAYPLKHCPVSGRSESNPAMDMLKTLIHIHTDYSFDSDISVEALAAFARENRIQCVAVTDHDTIEGALRLRAIAPDLRVIVGEEISTRDGHLIGLFLKERIEPGMSARETALAIKRQGGLVLLPHPFVKAFGCGLQGVSWEIADLLDAVEICNSQNLLSAPDRKAAEFADRLGLPAYVGADSHQSTSIAPCFQLLPKFDGPKGFLSSLRSAALSSGRHGLGYFLSAATRVLRHLLGLPLPRGFGANHRDAERVPHVSGLAA